MHLLWIDGLKGYEEILVTVMLDSLRLGLRGTIFNEADIFFYFGFVLFNTKCG